MGKVKQDKKLNKEKKNLDKSETNQQANTTTQEQKIEQEYAQRFTEDLHIIQSLSN